MKYYLILILSLVSCDQSKKSDKVIVKEEISKIESNKNVLDKNKVDEFGVFFDSFKKSLLENHRENLLNKISFPVSIKASLDEYDEVFLDETYFFKNFIKKYLEEEIVCEGGVLKRKTILLKNKCERRVDFNDKMIRIGDFIFKREKSKWKLFQLFSDVLIDDV